MLKHNRWSALFALSVTSCLAFACTDDGGSTGNETGTETGTETGDGDGDMSESSTTETMTGDGDGDETGDGDGDPATGDGDGDMTGDGDGDMTGDGDGDMTGDGDGDTGVCGDGVVDDGEVCDDGVNDGAYGGCAEDCSALGPYCGDSAVNGPEACDDGLNDNGYGGCAEDCSALGPFCGDAEVNGPEVCDDGVNDGAYGGCSEACDDLGEYCGDGEVNGPEECDDLNDANDDGCLGNCEVAHSCLEILQYEDTSETGEYLISPEGNQEDPFFVHCDMDTDGGGYTFYKVVPQNQMYAVEAEAWCAERGMQLWIPRSEEHVLSGWAISNDGNIGDDASPNYMRILGIYPDQNGATCNLQPMNSDNQNCGWGASDGEVWWVHERNNINEPNGDNTTIGSMYYTWFQDGTLNHHNDIIGVNGQGYTSDRFMCDVGDKLP